MPIKIKRFRIFAQLNFEQNIIHFIYKTYDKNSKDCLYKNG